MTDEEMAGTRGPRFKVPLIGLGLGLALVLLLPLAGVLLERARPPANSQGEFLTIDPESPTAADRRRVGRLEVLPGLLGQGGTRTEGLEAVLRLHLYLALRDVHPGSLLLDWAQPAPLADREQVLATLCDDSHSLSRPLRSGDYPDPLARPIDPARNNRLLLAVDLGQDSTRVEAILCNRQGATRSQIIDFSPGGEGPAIRELATWCAAVSGGSDPGPFGEVWERPPAPGRPGLTAYSTSLRASTARLNGPAPALSEAADAIPEAAWLLAHLGEPTDKAVHLRRAAAGRPLFTAAVEDRALLLLKEGRVAPAVEGLSGLTELGPIYPEWHPRRPLKLLLAGQLLEDGQAYAAKELLQTLTASEAEHLAAARLATLAALDLQEDAEAARLAEEWLAADPDSARASLIAGNSRSEAGDRAGAVTAWKNAASRDRDLRDEALRSWSEVALTEQQPKELLAFLDELAADEPRLSNFAREIRAYATALDGQPAAAHRLYTALAADQPGEQRHRLNRCSTALTAGVATATSGACTGLQGSQLEEAMIEAAQLSRQAGVLPGYPRDTSRPARTALAIAPRDRDVARTALYSLAPSSPPPVQEDLLARWRVAMGRDLPAPLQALEPPGPNR